MIAAPRCLLSLSGALLLSACLDDASGSSAAGSALSRVQVPEGAALRTSQSVQVRLSAQDAALPASGRGGLTLSLADGRVLFSGHLARQRELRLELSVPTKDGTLVAQLSGANGPARLELPITNGSAAGVF